MKLKKIMALILCAVLVTVGGVYATWNYAMGQIQAVSMHFATPVMADAVLDASVGTLKVDTRGLTVRIDDANNDHIAELDIQGSIKLVFTPHTDASPDIVANGIALKYTIEGLSAPQYNNQPIFTFTTITGTTPQALEYTINAAELKNAITINTISLPTYNDYQTFEKALPSTLLKITLEPANSTPTV